MIQAWYKTAVGAYQWAAFNTMLLFAHPRHAPKTWVTGIRQMARMPGYLNATVTATRKLGTILGQRKREIVIDRLDEVRCPTLVAWGDRDKVVPLRQAREAVSRLPRGRLAVFKDCGHLPHLEAASSFAEAVGGFLH